MQTLQFIDTHAHVHLTLERMKLEGFQAYREQFFPVPQAQDGHELEAIVNVYCETSELQEDSDHSLLDQWDHMYASFGLHPHNAKVWI
jgi:Tat protein secretion system quality control protein TatD with DNase activity